MKVKKKFKAPPTPLFMMLLALGFGAGYATKEFTESPTSTVTSQQAQPPICLNEKSVVVCFTPNKKCQSKIIHEIENAQKSIYVQAYSFTDKEIATALAHAASRGVAVKVLLDKSNRNDNRSAKEILLHQNIPLRFDAPSGIAHNKIMIIDETRVISGSYNFSAAAYKRNTENVLVIHNSPLAQDYIKNWHHRWQVSR